MSLTSYRAAPPCVIRMSKADERSAFIVEVALVVVLFVLFVLSVFCRSGGGLLFRGLSLSIMGAGAFHGRVRDGIGCRHSALEPPGRLKIDFVKG